MQSILRPVHEALAVVVDAVEDEEAGRGRREAGRLVLAQGAERQGVARRVVHHQHLRVEDEVAAVGERPRDEVLEVAHLVQGGSWLDILKTFG